MRTRISGLSLGNQVLGEQRVAHAELEKVRVIGVLHAQDCRYKELKVLGEAVCESCQIDVVSVNGTMRGEDCHVKKMVLLGEGEFYRSELEYIRVLGRLCGSDISAAHVCVGSRFMFSMHGRNRKQLLAKGLQGELLENLMPLQLSDQRFETIVNEEALVCDGEVECRSFFTFHDTRIHELNTDFCYIEPFHRIGIKELHASLVIIDPGFDPAWMKDIRLTYPLKKRSRNQKHAHVRIDCIEADEVVVDYAHIALIRGDRITIGPHASIDQIEYRISCEIHEQAVVKNVVKV